MHGIPVDLDITFLHNSELIQVCLSLSSLQFNFHPIGSILVEGNWELLSVEGICIDHYQDTSNRSPYLLHHLLGQKIIGSEVFAPKYFALRFENGEILRVFDSSKEYESFSIQPGGIFV